ncbi:MAG: thioredoxin-disulfide reductase [Proteobacteria bacterium]|nr:thioredoxin-disulfide reductase [Pseudomonadota bacterium]MBU1740710.1 thioredoxin-disulfide reductase [Pseudomonadota bacterium]
MDYELVIIGAGPAGLTAGLYAARAEIKTVILEKISPGGQVLNTDWVDNYPGFPEGLSGFDLVDKMRAHAERFGVEIRSAEVSSLAGRDTGFELALAGEKVTTGAVILATGAHPRPLGVEGEAEFIGRGVSYCATCDGPFYKNATLAVVGGGDSAVEEAIYLTRFADRVYIIHRRDKFRAVEFIAKRALDNDKITPVWDTVVEKIAGREQVEAVHLKNVKTGEPSVLEVNGVFSFVGLIPDSELVVDLADRDDIGFVLTDEDMRTRTPGLFVAGDVRHKLLRQISTAVGDGATAAFAAQHYLENLLAR